VKEVRLGGAVAAAARVGCELLPAQKDTEVAIRAALLSSVLSEVVPEHRDGEVSNGRAHRRQVADDVPAETRPDGLDAERIAGALNGGPVV